jgi:multidrug efflux pump subunit AcrA (membrane-fusion protein)
MTDKTHTRETGGTDERNGSDPLAQWERVTSRVPGRSGLGDSAGEVSGSGDAGTPRASTNRAWWAYALAAVIVAASVWAVERWVLEPRRIRTVDHMVVERIRWGAAATATGRHAGLVDHPSVVRLSGPSDAAAVRIHAVEGGRILTGDTLIIFDSDRITLARDLAREAYDASMRDSVRIHGDWVRGNAAITHLETARLAVAERRTEWRRLVLDHAEHVLVSPLDGRVLDIRIEVGERPSGVTIELIDDAYVWVLVDIDEMDAASLRRGQPAVVVLDADPMTDYAGVVEGFAQSADAASHTLEARIRVERPGPFMRKGMSATVHVTEMAMEGHGPAVFAVVLDTGFVASESIQQMIMQGDLEPLPAKVWTMERGLAISRNILVGSRLGAWVSVLDGLDPGAIVVKSPSEHPLVEDERIRIRE